MKCKSLILNDLWVFSCLVKNKERSTSKASNVVTCSIKLFVSIQYISVIYLINVSEEMIRVGAIAALIIVDIIIKLIYPTNAVLFAKKFLILTLSKTRAIFSVFISLYTYFLILPIVIALLIGLLFDRQLIFFCLLVLFVSCLNSMFLTLVYLAKKIQVTYVAVIWAVLLSIALFFTEHLTWPILAIAFIYINYFFSKLIRRVLSRFKLDIVNNGA